MALVAVAGAGLALAGPGAAQDDPAPPDPAMSPAAIEPEPEPAAPKPDPAEQAETAPDVTAPADPAPAAREPAVHAAASGSVSIKDFEFGPTTITIDVGDSVTWNNAGPTVHTATANNGSFDSGNLSRGESFSHRFTSAGTVSYFCTPHPFMTAKVVVRGASGSGTSSGGGGSAGAAGSGSTGGSDATGTDAATAEGATTASGDDLPNTGRDVAPWALFGLGLLSFGAALRYRLSAD